MAGTHSAGVCSVTDEVVAVKWMVALASRTYGEDRMRERERAQMHGLWLAMGELVLGGAPRPWQRWQHDNVALPVLI